MAKTMLADVIVPELFTSYVMNAINEKSALVQSGIITTNENLNSLVTGGGKLLNMPFWGDLGGEDEVLSEKRPLTPAKISASKDVACMLIRGKAWSASELSGAMAGSDPMQAIASQVATFWVRRDQQTLLSLLSGVFSIASMADHIANNSTSAISAKMVLDAKQLLGDAADQLTAMAMHSAVYTELQKQNLIDFIQPANANVTIPSYLGYSVIVDDKVPYDSTTKVFSTYLFANGVIGKGEGVPTSLTPVETDRDSLQSDDILIHRRAFALHPFGIKFTNKNVVDETPSNLELADAENWERVYEPKQIGLVLIKHKLGS